MFRRLSDEYGGGGGGGGDFCVKGYLGGQNYCVVNLYNILDRLWVRLKGCTIYWTVLRNIDSVYLLSAKQQTRVQHNNSS
jgi:hypothetical protein